MNMSFSRPVLQPHHTVEVYQMNLKQAFAQLKLALMTYKVISINTKFPGAIFKEPKFLPPEKKYLYIKKNVDAVKLIQLGITLMNEKGELATPVCCWNFNLRFNIRQDASCRKSIEFLQRNGGINFTVLPSVGVDIEDFRKFAVEAKLFYNDLNTFIVFHGQYDIFFLLKAIARSLPASREESQILIRSVFGKIIDLKYMLLHDYNRKGYGLQRLADELNVSRIGTAYSAGSDSSLAGRTFFVARDMYHLFGNDQIQANELKIAGYDSFCFTNGKHRYY